jgi:hypothetical protein
VLDLKFFPKKGKMISMEQLHTENWRRCMMNTRKLSTGEWRLFLLSDCIKYFKDADEFTRDFRKMGKKEVLSLDGTDSKELDHLISDEDAIQIKRMLMKEWSFTGKVKDNGRGIKTTCEYCQKQQIRYRYICRNNRTGHTLDLGSVCVGNILHGEEKMKNKEFNKKFVEEMENFKPHGYSEPPAQVRANQVELVRKCIAFLHGKGITVEKDSFLSSLKEQWGAGRALTPAQIEALKNKCRKYRGGKGA